MIADGATPAYHDQPFPTSFHTVRHYLRGIPLLPLFAPEARALPRDAQGVEPQETAFERLSGAG